MTCKDCIHEGVCKLKDEKVSLRTRVEDLDSDNFACFKNKSDYVTKDEIAQIIWERDKAIEQLRSYGVDFCQEKKELAEVKHGYWKDDTSCSVCGHEALVTTWDEAMYDDTAEDSPEYLYNVTHIEFHTTDYCPFCGAKMDGGSET